MVCATRKASDQPAHMRSLIRVFPSRLIILCTRTLLEITFTAQMPFESSLNNFLPACLESELHKYVNCNYGNLQNHSLCGPRHFIRGWGLCDFFLSFFKSSNVQRAIRTSLVKQLDPLGVFSREVRTSIPKETDGHFRFSRTPTPAA